MHIRTVTFWLIPSLCLAFSPTADKILTRMENEMRRPSPVVLQVVREAPDGSAQREYRISIPADSTEDTGADQDFLFPFSFLTLPRGKVLNVFKSFSDGKASVKLDRLEGFICYLIEGQSERLWLRKKDFIPLKVEDLSYYGQWTAYLYLDPVTVFGKTVYPSHTEVHRNGSVIMVERLIPAYAATGRP